MDNNNIICDNDKINFGTLYIGGLKGSLKKIENKIKIILSSENYGSVKLISLRKTYHNAYEKCIEAIETFGTVLKSGSIKWHLYCSQIEEVKFQFNDIEEHR